MRHYLLILFLLPSFSFAIDGTITVIEAPLFYTPDESSKVIQYLRKGDRVYLHPSETYQDKYSFEEFKNLDETKIDNLDDPLLNEGTIYRANTENKFLKTIAKDGREAYILREHVFIDFNDKRELNQPVISHDNTDYRLEEPINKNYPFIKSGNYRGQMSFSLGEPNYTAYPYQQRILDSSSELLKEVDFVWSRAEAIDKKNRFFFGAKGGLHFSKIKHLLETQSASQSNFRLTIGPYASYDTFKTESSVFNIYTSLQYHLVDRMEISISDNSGISDSRVYDTYLGFSGNLGFNYQIFKSVYTFDTIMGANLRMLAPREYTTNDNPQESSLWQSSSSKDSYNQPFTTEMSYFIGLQSYY